LFRFPQIHPIHDARRLVSPASKMDSAHRNGKRGVN